MALPPPTVVPFNPNKKMMKKKQKLIQAVEEEEVDMRDGQELLDSISSDEGEGSDQTIVETSGMATQATTSAGVTAATKVTRKRKAAKQPEADEDEEEVIGLIKTSGSTSASAKRPKRRIMISERTSLINYSPRFKNAKYYSIAKMKDDRVEFDFGFPNHEMPSLLNAVLTAFSKDHELMQHLKAEPKLTQSIKELYKNVMTQYKS